MKVRIGAVVVCMGAALVAGVVAGVLVTQAAQVYNKGWINGDAFLDRSSAFQQGYVAGMADAVLHIAFNQAKEVDWTERARCLDRDSGLTSSTDGHLPTLVSWAERTLRAHPSDASNYHAASTLIINACE